MDEKTALLCTASRLYALDVYGAQDYNETPETIADILESDPLSIINSLLDIIDDLQEG